MFAINKENLVLQAPPHGGKASNANPKTPGPQKLHPKTPFKIPAGNDENAAGNTANPKTGKKMGMMAQQFITPAPGPRQVLGRKTTNAKARNLAPMDGDLGGSLKPKTPGSSLRPLKSKLTVAHDPEAAIQEEDDIPDIEYIPPRSEEPPLVPDILDPVDYNFINQNLMRGCYRSYLSGVDDNGKTRTQRLLEKSERLENEALDKETALLLADLQNGLQPPHRRTIKTKSTSTKLSSASSRLARQPSSSHKTTTVRHMPQEGERVRSTSTSRPSSRPTSRASSHVRQSSTCRPTSRSGASTLDSRTAANLLSQRPSSSTSTSRPSSRSGPTSQIRSTSRPSSRAGPTSNIRSTSTHRNPSASGTMRSASRSSPSLYSRSRSGSNVVSRTTVGHTKGRELAPRVKETLKVESSTEMIHRILMEDLEAEENAVVPMVHVEPEEMLQEEREEQERMRRLLDGIVVEEDLHDDDDFVLNLPGLDDEELRF